MQQLATIRYGVAVVSVTAAVIANLSLPATLDTEVLLLGAVVITGWFSGLRPALLAWLLVTLAYDYYFIPPLHAWVPDVAQVPRLTIFIMLAAAVATISAGRRTAEDSLKSARDELEDRVRERTAELERSNEQLHAEIGERRRAEEALRERANLLDLTHDTVFVRDLGDVITLWNRGAEEQYGWTRQEAIGRVSHQLLQTEFPAPLEAITGALYRTGRWEGELVQTRRDGTKIVVASRWALQTDERGTPAATLETNNDITARKRAEQALEDLAGRLIGAQEEERRRIGRELHDHISQMLSVLTTEIDQLLADPTNTLAIAAALDQLRQRAIDVTDDVRRLSHRLHSSTLDYLGLAPAMQKLVAEFSEHYSIPMNFAQASLPASLPSEVALALFRVTEESLTNIAKHSRARSARVTVHGAADGIHLTVEDDGNGFDMTALASRGGLGFVSMQERLRVLRGTVRVDSAPSRGTRIDVWVPSPSLVRSAPIDAEGEASTGKSPPSVSPA